MTGTPAGAASWPASIFTRALEGGSRLLVLTVQAGDELAALGTLERQQMKPQWVLRPEPGARDGFAWITPRVRDGGLSVVLYGLMAEHIATHDPCDLAMAPAFHDEREGYTQVVITNAAQLAELNWHARWARTWRTGT